MSFFNIIIITTKQRFGWYGPQAQPREGTVAGKLYKSGQKPSKNSKQASRSSSSSGSKKQNNRSHGTERKSTRGGNYGRGR